MTQISTIRQQFCNEVLYEENSMPRREQHMHTQVKGVKVDGYRAAP